jgi:uncharacterized protein YndB with AHSA1/START domain
MSTATQARPETPVAKTKYPHTLTMPTERTLHIEREFDASRDRVWRAMTDPKLLSQWWGRGNPLTIEKFDFKVGGQWRFVEHSDGGNHGFQGEFREIAPIDRLTWTFGWDGMEGKQIVDAIVFTDLGKGRTKIVVTSTFHSQEDRDAMVGFGMEAGMAESYAALDRLLATGI